MAAEASLPHAVVLGLQVTGLATARCLADGGVRVHGISLRKEEIGRVTRCCEVIEIGALTGDSEAFCAWLQEYSRGFTQSPVVIPTSDATALMLAAHRSGLEAYCHTWRTPIEQLEAIICKNQLYENAAAAGIRVAPMIIDAGRDEIEAWCREHPPPYLIKPYYKGHDKCALREKNLSFHSPAELLAHVDRFGAESLIVQRKLRGGDGWIFDTYGLSSGRGKILSIASHRRIRQFPPHTGTTCFGEIPGAPRRLGESELFVRTERLLAGMDYHGIFGIEWLEDRESGELYLLDFNARPFTTIGHLADCGLNLPLLAFRELLGLDLGGLDERPRLRHKHWLHLSRDMRTFRILRRQGELGWLPWLGSLTRSNSFAYWRLTDPRPGWTAICRLIRALMKFLLGSNTQEEKRSADY